MADLWLLQQAVDRQINDAAKKTNALVPESSQRNQSGANSPHAQFADERRQQVREVKAGRDALLRELNGIEAHMAALTARWGMMPQQVEVGQLVQTQSGKQGPVSKKQGTRVRLKDDGTGKEVWREAKALAPVELEQRAVLADAAHTVDCIKHALAKVGPLHKA